MRKLIIAVALLLTQVAPVAASNEDTPNEAAALRTYVNAVEENAKTSRAEKRNFDYSFTKASIPVKMKSIPLGERYDQLVRLVNICKEYNLNGCLAAFVPNAIFQSYTENFMTVETDSTGSTEAQRLSFIEMIMRDLVTKDTELKIFDLQEASSVTGYAARQAKDRTVPTDLRKRYAEFYKTYCIYPNHLSVYYKIMASIESPQNSNN